MANVFISHRGTDLPEAERLAFELRNGEHSVWLDEWSIKLGDSIVAKMNEGLDAADYVVVCYSSSGVLAPWMGREWMSALARQMNSSRVKLLPVMLSGGLSPAILEDVKYCDLAKDWPRGVSELLRSIV